MDNLTHSLIGAALGQAGLKRKTGLAMPAMIIAANLPDVDAPCAVFGIESLAMRRGLSHGPVALLLLPALLALALWWFDRWQAGRGKRPEARLRVHFGWLLALCYLGAFSHPLFDWFNNYGIRLLEPFSSQWYYGDTLFIIDPWILAMLGAGVWFSLKRERAGLGWRWPANLAIWSTAIYVLLNMFISSTALYFYDGPRVAVANAVPGKFWEREVLWRDDCSMAIRRCPEHYGSWRSSVFSSGPDFDLKEFGPTNMSDPRIELWAKTDAAAQAFLFWSRMPVAELHEDRIVLRDQRFMDPRVVDRFSVTLRPPK